MHLLLIIFLILMRNILLFRFLLFSRSSRCSLPYRHTLRYYGTEANTLICLHQRLVISIGFIILLFARHRILTQQTLQFSLIAWIRIFRWTTIIYGVESPRYFSIFGHFIILNLQILLSIILFLVNILHRSFFLKIRMYNSIVLI